MTLELTSGFWQLYELNTVLGARLARDPDADPAEITDDWVRRWFSTDPATVQAITDAMALSRDAVTHGLYIGPYADKRVFAIGLEPPPMMWIFEWDILTGDSAVLDVIYSVSEDRLDEAIDEGDEAVATAGDATHSDTLHPGCASWSGHRRRHLARRGAARRARRHPRLPGEPASSCWRRTARWCSVTPSGSTPAPATLAQAWAAGPGPVRRGRRRPRGDSTPGTSTCRRTT